MSNDDDDDLDIGLIASFIFLIVLALICGTIIELNTSSTKQLMTVPILEKITEIQKSQQNLEKRFEALEKKLQEETSPVADIRKNANKILKECQDNVDEMARTIMIMKRLQRN